MERFSPNLFQRIIVKLAVLLCLSSGIDLSTEKYTCTPHRALAGLNLRKTFVIIIRLLMCSQLLLYGLDNFTRQYLTLNSSTSSTDFIRLVFAVIYPVLHAQAMACLWLNEGFLRELFDDTAHRKYFNCWKLGGYVLCWAWYTTVDIHLALVAGNAGKQSAYIFSGAMAPVWCGIHSKQCQYLVLVLFSVSQTVLQGHLNHLDSLVGNLRASEILKKKEAARHITSNVNKAFSTVFAFLFVKVFLLFYIFLSNSFIHQKVVDWTALVNIGPALQVIMLYDLASGGSEIINSCRRCASRALSRDSGSLPEKDNDSQWSRLVQVVSYDELQDSLTILDCFTFTKQSLFSYLAIIITCTAVILQFDYRVLAKLDRDKSLYELQYRTNTNNISLTRST